MTISLEKLFGAVESLDLPRIGQIFKGTGIRGIASLVGATAFAQMISVAFSPIITRIYLPSDYGEFAFFSSILGILTPLAALRYEQAIIIAGDDYEASSLARLSLTIISIGSIFLLMLSLIGPFPGTRGDGGLLRKNHLFSVLLCLAFLFSGIYLVFYYWGLRKQAFRLIARTKVVQGMSGVISQIGLGLLGWGSLGLIVSYVFTNSAGGLSLGRFFKSTSKHDHPHGNRFRLVAQKYKNFAIYSLPAAFISNIGLLAPPILIMWIYGSASTGYFSLAQRVIALPLGLVGYSIGNVFTSEMAKAARGDPSTIMDRFKKYSMLLGIGGLIIMMIGAIAPFIFPLIFGAKWRIAGIFAAITAIPMAFQFLSVPLSSMTAIGRSLKQQLIIDISRTVGVFFVFGFARILDMSAYSCLVLYGALISLSYFTAYIYYRKIARSMSKDRIQMPS